MREILFRGKRLDNEEWVQGDLLRYGASETNIHYYAHGVRRAAWVDPSTVGQYTGLTDKNGKRIFEGDKFDKYNSVEYCNGGFCVNGDVPLSYWSSTHEVIGTVYDNSELLGGADNG